MLRKIDYIFGLSSIAPHSPQFAGIQGENGATKLCFTADTEMQSVINSLRENYDSIVWRFDCIDGTGQKLTSTVEEYGNTDIELTLTSAYTVMGGNIKGVLIISGVNNSTENPTELYSIPFELYFEDFPIKDNLDERKDLNQALLQVKQMRAETYEIAAAALENGQDISKRVDEFNVLADEMTDTLEQLEQSTKLSETAARSASDSAAQCAGSALTYSVQASGNAADAKGYADAAANSASMASTSEAAAALSAQSAAAEAQKLMGITGDINAVLATVVAGV